MAMTYRPDIDGLRALAVVPVIFFHSGLSTFPGGYVGVDVFFVISGYLITSILLEDVESGRFSILSFYERRVRRIFPALFVVLAGSAGAALYVMFASELYEFANSLIAAAFFYSNYFFMFDAGYFAAPSETKPLLHIWSLAVEEQFYIVFPLYLLVVMRLPRYQAVAITALFLIMSLAYSVNLVDRAPGDAFFSAPSRFWELLAGATLAMSPTAWRLSVPIANALTLAGLGLILYAILAFSDNTPFPGLAAIAPVAGTALIIIAGAKRRNLVATVLSVAPVRFIGLISYSLYLWHWPVLVFYKLWKISPPTSGEIMLLWCVTAGLSYLTWKYVETPFRRRQRLPDRKRILAAGIAAMLVTGAAAQLAMNGNGLPNRFPDHLQPILDAASDTPASDACQNVDTAAGTALTVCDIGNTQETDIEFVFWGDSHGLAMLPAVHRSAVDSQNRGVFVGRGGCPPILGVRQAQQDASSCPDLAEAFIAYLSEHPEIRQVIIAARWSIYAMGERYRGEDGTTVYIRDAATDEVSLQENRAVFRRAIERTLSTLESMGKRVVLVAQVPETEFDLPRAAARKAILDRGVELRPFVAHYRQRNEFVTDIFSDAGARYGIRVARPQDLLCGQIHCRVMHNGIPIYSDSSHLTATFSETLADLFDPIWTDPD